MKSKETFWAICFNTLIEFGKTIPFIDAGYPFIGTWKMRRTSFSLPERALAKWMGHCSKSNVLMLSTGLPFHSRLVMSSIAFMDYEILLNQGTCLLMSIAVERSWIVQYNSMIVIHDKYVF